MAQKYVPINKQSKKAKQEYYSKKRPDWGAVNPVSKEFKSKKRFNKATRGKTKSKLRTNQFYCRMIE